MITNESINDAFSAIGEYMEDVRNKVKQEIEKTIRNTLKGNIRIEASGGWWELCCEATNGWQEYSTGAEFGMHKLNELIENINKIIEEKV